MEYVGFDQPANWVTRGPEGRDRPSVTQWSGQSPRPPFVAVRAPGRRSRTVIRPLDESPVAFRMTRMRLARWFRLHAPAYGASQSAALFLTFDGALAGASQPSLLFVLRAGVPK